MGSGASRDDTKVIARLDRIEGILDGMKGNGEGDNSHMVKVRDGMKAENDKTVPPGKTAEEPYETNDEAPLVKKTSSLKLSKQASPPAASTSRKGSKERKTSVTFGEKEVVKEAKAQVVQNEDQQNDTDDARRNELIANKKKQTAVKARRTSFFSKYQQPEEPTDPSIVKCAPIGCIAVAMSLLLRDATQNSPTEKVTVEDIFYDLKLPLHYVTLPALTMAEAFDLASKYSTRGEKPKAANARIQAKVVHFDLDEFETYEDCYSTEPVLSLTGFCKELTKDMHEPGITHILNLDPYVLQEAKIALLDEEFDSDDEDVDCVKEIREQHKKKIAALRVVRKKNQGAFAILSSYNPSLSKAQVSTPVLNTDGVYLSKEEAPLSVLYGACSGKDGYTKRPRGFVRLSLADQTCSERDLATLSPPLVYPMEVIEASTDYGMLLELIDPQISPHIVAIGLAIHLYNSAHGNAIPRVTKGVAVSDICTMLNLPVQAIVGGSEKTALQEGFSLLKAYLDKTECSSVHLGVAPLERKSGAEDGMPNYDCDELREQVEIVLNGKGKEVMILNFHVNKSHNVVGLESDGKVSHFGILVGFNPETDVVSIADVSPKKFKKVWHAPLERLWESMINFGYILLTPTPDRLSDNNAGTHAEAIMKTGEFKLPPPLSFTPIEFPAKVYCVTVIAIALTLSGHPTDIEEVVYKGGFPLSFLLSDHLTLGDFERVLQNCIAGKNYPLTVKSKHVEQDASGVEKIDLDGFRSDVIDVMKHPDQSLLVFNFSGAALTETEEWYNGANNGSYGILQEYDDETTLVTVLSACPLKMKRVFEIPLGVLYGLCKRMDQISQRARGYLIVSKGVPETGWRYVLTRAAISHPFKPPVSPHIVAVAFAVSELFQRISPEDVFYAYYRSVSSEVVTLSSLSSKLVLEKLFTVIDVAAKTFSVPLTHELLSFSTVEELKEVLSDLDTKLSSKLLFLSIVPSNLALRIKDHSILCGIITEADSFGVTVTGVNPTKFHRSWNASWEDYFTAVTSNSTYYGLVKLTVA